MFKLNLKPFEDLHPNHKYAYLDGFLCGIVVAYLANSFYTDYRESQDFKRRVKAAEEAEKAANTAPITE